MNSGSSSSSTSTRSLYEKAVLDGLQLAQGRGVSRDQLRRFVADRLFGGDLSRINDAQLDSALLNNVEKGSIATASSRLPTLDSQSSSSSTSASDRVAGQKRSRENISSKRAALETAPLFVDRVGSFSDDGDREYQEDRSVVLRDETRDLFAAAVFDGHCGAFAAEYLSNGTSGLLRRLFATERALPPRASRRTASALFKDYDTELWHVMESGQMSDSDGDYAGCTACILVRHGNAVALYNVGDSRAALYDASGKVLLHTIDHSPDRPKECRRVTRAGGTVDYDVAGCFRVDGFLAMARSFGDFQLKDETRSATTSANGDKVKGTVLAKPDVFIAPLAKQATTYAIVASDGFWDSVGTAEAGEQLAILLSKDAKVDLDSVAKKLGSDALKKTRENDEDADNITVLVVEMRPI